jgi:transcriptional regulator with GAF, ATPase, and Fis domain
MAMAQALMTHGHGARTPQANLRQLVEAYERRLIIEALVRAHGNQRRAAAELGCLPTTLNEKMRRLGLRACDRQLDESQMGDLEMMGHA